MYDWMAAVPVCTSDWLCHGNVVQAGDMVGGVVRMARLEMWCWMLPLDIGYYQVKLRCVDEFVWRWAHPVRGYFCERKAFLS